MLKGENGEFDLELDFSRFFQDSQRSVKAGRSRYGGSLFSERHLKCVWFDSSLRPLELPAHDGRAVTVQHPGRWNLEGGPDFLGASLLVRTGGRRSGSDAGAGSGQVMQRVTGDVEIHVNPADWQRHGHSRDPAYDGVRAHVTYNQGSLPPGVLPKGALQISMKDALAANPRFSFESLDITAYPFSKPPLPSPCFSAIQAARPDQLERLLETTGSERLLRKGERMARVIDERGAAQALYEETMSALGYKRNSAQFRQLAERLPVACLREACGTDELSGYALLMGVAGLLPVRVKSNWDSETRSFVRRLWNFWWKHQFEWQDRAMQKRDWASSAIRPQNKPQRRLMAAACLFCGPDTLERRLLKQRKLDEISLFIQQAGSHRDYWSYRFELGGSRREAPVSIIGKARASSIVTNVIIPFAAAARPSAISLELLRRLPPEEDNSIMRQTAFALFGPDHNPAFYRTGLRQQGLLHVFHEYCVNDKSGCGSCPFPALLTRFFRGATMK